MNNLVCGVGINDKVLCGPSCTSRKSEGGKKYLPDYDMWKGMLLRCFSEKEKIRRPGSKEPVCVDEWKYRKNFQDWYFKHDLFTDSQGNTLQLDKDILFVNNNVYSPTTCILVPQYVNTAFRSATSIDVPWVYFKKNLKTKPYRASVYYCGKHYEAGFYKTAIEGHLASQIMKIYTLELLANDYTKEKSCDQRVFDAIEVRIELLKKYNSKKRICKLF